MGDVINQTPQTSCVETVEGSCIWQDNSCNLNWGGVWNSDSCSPQDGNCTLKNETISGSCEKEGLLTYSWNATWAGNNVNGLKAQCTEGYTRIPCAAQLKLPFFGAISFVMVLGIIALVYFFRRK